MPEGGYAKEPLTHFRCGKCEKWWTIGDTPEAHRKWFCPWCGAEQAFREIASGQGLDLV